jgi:type II secretory pathway component PulF
MLFSARLSLDNLIHLCRVLRHNLAAGLMLRAVFKQQATRGPAPLRPIAQRIAQVLEEGDSLETALQSDQDRFPPLFLALAGVGESTGHLPEIFGELEKYYLMQQKFWRQFWSQALLPIIQLVMAIFIIAGLIIIFDYIGSPIAPFGMGLRGIGGACVFLLTAFGSMAALVLGYKVISRSVEQKALVDRLFLSIPGIGPLIEALNLSRFSLALALTLDSGMSIVQALGISLRGTGNATFAKCINIVQDSLRTGDPLAVALTKTRIFPDDFLHIVSVGEEGGRVPEIMRQQAKRYEDEAELRLAVATRLGGFGVWLFVALLIIIAIFRIIQNTWTHLNI